jgi:hypothetical protein
VERCEGGDRSERGPEAGAALEAHGAGARQVDAGLAHGRSARVQLDRPAAGTATPGAMRLTRRLAPLGAGTSRLRLQQCRQHLLGAVHAAVAERDADAVVAGAGANHGCLHVESSWRDDFGRLWNDRWAAKSGGWLTRRGSAERGGRVLLIYLSRLGLHTSLA